MKLVVLAGAKKNASVPLKRDRFVIGRSKECSLRAGSDAISRRHCEIVLKDGAASVQDLGSRNGTYVNDQKIGGETALNNGDLLRVGPLEFRFESEGQLNEVKKPKVEGLEDAVARVAEKAASGDQPQGIEDSISDWLLDDGPADASAQSIRETQTFSVDETRAMAEELATPDEAEGEGEEQDPEHDSEEASEDEQKGWLKKKKEPGKLPKDAFASQQTKDSREAAEQILRDMARRR